MVRLPKNFCRDLDQHRILVTGGAGFIGSTLVETLFKTTNAPILNIDKLTYAACKEQAELFKQNDNYSFVKADISDFDIVLESFKNFQPTMIFHLAAESHVDRSILGPQEFINTNVIGTFNLLQAFQTIHANELGNGPIFINVSTDEVYGDMIDEKCPASEDNKFRPSSPYSAAKASADLIAEAWHRTYNFPVITTHCTNNFGPRQYPEKLIPLSINRALSAQQIPIYGDGQQIRDWLFVDDHAQALLQVAEKGRQGETYNIAGQNLLKNIDLISMVCDILDQSNKKETLNVKSKCQSFRKLIKFVDDRPGHDLKYWVNDDKIRKNLRWSPNCSFQEALTKTVYWFEEQFFIN